MDSLNSSTNNPLIGALAENDACDFLITQGLHLIEKNFLVINSQGKRTGEIDLIMRDDISLVFVEVKKRNSDDYGNVLEMISKQKQSRIIRTATHYLVQHNCYDKVYCRFDVVGISPDEKTPSIQKIEWIKNAFEVQY